MVELISIWFICPQPAEGTAQFTNTPEPAAAFEAAVRVCDSR